MRWSDPAACALIAALALCIAAGVAQAVRWLRRSLYLVTVDGLSMEPTLMPGDRLLVARPWSRFPRVGDIVIAPRPTAPDWAGQGAVVPVDGSRGWVVKRVAATAGDLLPDSLESFARLRGRSRVPNSGVLLLGDGRFSEDSRHWGFCPQQLIMGRVLCRVARG